MAPGGVENRMEVLWHHGVNTGRLTMNEFVAVTSTNAAQIFNIYPRKGSVSVRRRCRHRRLGSRGDEDDLGRRPHFQNVDYNIFEGMTVKGCASHTISQGKVVYADGKLDVERGAGRYVDRPPFASYYDALKIVRPARRTRSRSTERAPGVAENRPDRQSRLSQEDIDRNFDDLHPPLSRSEALIEADRCYFCYDAPCTTACPTGIDIPGFIQKIRSDNVAGSAHTILSENIMGGMCARVCPTEVLCEEACVRNTHEDKPVEIGLLQRYATDPVFEQDAVLRARACQTGKKVAVVGGGPAGLSCAHRLAVRWGTTCRIFNRDDKLGGLNEYGIAAYKTVDDFAQREVDYILGIGGIESPQRRRTGRDVPGRNSFDDYDAVFLGIGLGDVNNPRPRRRRPGRRPQRDRLHRRSAAGRRTRAPAGRPIASSSSAAA